MWPTKASVSAAGKLYDVLPAFRFNFDHHKWISVTGVLSPSPPTVSQPPPPVSLASTPPPDSSCCCLSPLQRKGTARNDSLSSEVLFSDEEKSQWLRFDDLKDDGSQFSLVTWNVWFDSFMFGRRCQEMFAILRKLNPDFICFQEVTSNFVSLICKEEFVRESYFVSDVNGNTVQNYGTMMLSRYALDSFHRFNFESSAQGRSLLAAPFSFASESAFVVSTSHLESISKYAPLRIEQLEKSFELLDSTSNAVMCGDFNFCQDWKENSHIRAEYVDLWQHLRGDEPGYTMPPRGTFKAWRPDRILLKSDADAILPLEIMKIGTEPIDYPELNEKEKSTFVLTPSDHHGLFAKFSLNLGR
eukprot:TRINITY_DN12030_c0_g1_i1.p1 TRINITY_DN12030_c0_g1~~TRINITY_DN12030_c0_g1_i1.p1  ORF type:complete len:358 (-),score=73.44 TRINITY_DN12030_c0_g1_i1:113-1186(-)